MRIFLYVSQCLRLGDGTTSSLLAGFRRTTSIYYYLYQHYITNIFKVPRKVFLLRETYATVRSKRYEPLRPRRMACHVRAVDPAVPDWDLAPIHTTHHHLPRTLVKTVNQACHRPQCLVPDDPTSSWDMSSGLVEEITHRFSRVDERGASLPFICWPTATRWAGERKRKSFCG
ncbi:hypothetical protein EDD85DRAFT_65514 [Armillaria nabsnona]|nr:hypothetical protein EDD85DRAFT_65514 [Armillaria nabsnona]